jgi:energy-coupling factor transporter transmembrane protein EcfT
MKFFMLLIAFVFIMNSVSIKGEPIPCFPIQAVSQEGVTAGLVFAWRLIFIITLCAIITGSTTLLTFNKVVEWYLRPIPFIPEARLATMINMTFVIIPLILDQYSEMANAQKSRCVESRKNPIKRILFIALPLLSNTLKKADELIYAMESRCYSEIRTKATFQFSLIDGVVLFMSLLAVGFVIFF